MQGAHGERGHQTARRPKPHGPNLPKSQPEQCCRKRLRAAITQTLEILWPQQVRCQSHFSSTGSKPPPHTMPSAKATKRKHSKYMAPSNRSLSQNGNQQMAQEPIHQCVTFGSFPFTMAWFQKKDSTLAPAPTPIQTPIPAHRSKTPIQNHTMSLA